MGYLRAGGRSSRRRFPKSQLNSRAAAVRLARVSTYNSLKTLALVSTVLLALNGLIAMIGIPSAIMQLDVLDRIDLGTVSDAELESNDSREIMLGFVGMALYFAAGVAFLSWFHRAYTNLAHFGYERAHGTGWAIGAWFVPIISLYRPYQMACEIWRASDPEPPAELDILSKPPLLRAWWTLWIIGLVVGQIAFRLSLQASTVDALRTSTTIQIVADVLDLLAAPVAIMVVRELTRRQEARAAAMATGAYDIAKVFE